MRLPPIRSPRKGALILAASLLAPVGCVAGAPERPAGAPQPPAPLQEFRSAQPAPGVVWMPGVWHWDGADYVWVPGRWESPPPVPAPPGRAVP